ncbi:MAG: exodeoxyribonuclease VII small subunit [Gammaproteobacteria bacterium RIFCSPLOWO2_02_FULL_56_15]|nr:MAG: exodeoxyribonuclease VII small subunit [Gammaproteobacteria bacterium RIFCSPLOWO2_02_FULL_56_15]
MVKKKLEFNFEQTLAELEAIVEQMERGDLGLEESIRNFERGITLTRACQKALTEAEQKVQILLQENGAEVLTDFKETDQKE